jgi:hypothetical protein
MSSTLITFSATAQQARMLSGALKQSHNPLVDLQFCQCGLWRQIERKREKGICALLPNLICSIYAK